MTTTTIRVRVNPADTDEYVICADVDDDCGRSWLGQRSGGRWTGWEYDEHVDASMIGRRHGLVIDCPDPSSLATFYEELLGMQRVQEEPGWVVIGDAADRPGVAFQRVHDLRPPRWPDPDRPQQMHVDVRVDDLDEAESRVLERGARRLPGGGERFRVYADPADHPFCLVS